MPNESSEGMNGVPGTIYLAFDEEGIVTVVTPLGRVPLVAIDDKTLQVLRTYSNDVADETGEQVTIVGFTAGSVYERFPDPTTGDHS